jgi:hypothetical protein
VNNDNSEFKKLSAVFLGKKVVLNKF